MPYLDVDFPFVQSATLLAQTINRMLILFFSTEELLLKILVETAQLGYSPKW